ncbi:MAG: hypothetical protein RJQ09_04075 [Cyclobacteriaceae bacterium]
MAAGLAIGCGIYASGGGTFSYLPESAIIIDALQANTIISRRYLLG